MAFKNEIALIHLLIKNVLRFLRMAITFDFLMQSLLTFNFHPTTEIPLTINDGVKHEPFQVASSPKAITCFNT